MPQDPAAIQRQIEQTRAELAEAIDAIVDIVSPKRLAERAKVQVGVKVSEIRQRVVATVQPLPALEPAAGAETEGLGYPPVLEEGAVVVRRTVRWDRVAYASGVVVLVVVVGNGRRRRRRAD